MKRLRPMHAKKATATAIEMLFSGPASMVAATALLVVAQSASAVPPPAGS